MESTFQPAGRDGEGTAFFKAALEDAPGPVETEQGKGTLSDFFLRPPFAGSCIDLERDPDRGREIEL